MSIKEIFGNETDTKKRSHLKNLVSIAKLDGKVSKKEYAFLLSLGKRVGVNEEEIKKMIKRTAKIEVTKPETVELTIEYIYDLVLMATADGVIDEKEIDLTIQIGEKLGLNPITSGVIVRKIFMLIEKQKTKDEIFEILKEHLLF